MRLILDSHILLGMAFRRLDRISPGAAQLVADGSSRLLASAASFWEIAIKTRLGKLDPGMTLDELPRFFEPGGSRSCRSPWRMPSLISSRSRGRGIRSTGSCWRNAWSRTPGW